jgi:hypothetical protein
VSDFAIRDGESLEDYIARLSVIDRATVHGHGQAILASMLEAARTALPSDLDRCKAAVRQLSEADRARLVTWLARDMKD